MKYNISLTPAQWRKIIDVLIEQTTNNVECFSLVNLMTHFSVSFDEDKEG